MIEHASKQFNKPPAEIFLEEWVTTGRIRPTLSHLLQLLIKSELFRVADYVAVNLLNGQSQILLENIIELIFVYTEAPPQRPSKGPAAKVDIALPLQDDDTDVHERIMDMNYPNSSEIMNLNNGHIQSKQLHSKRIFDGAILPDTPMSEVDLIRFSTAVRSCSNNVQQSVQNSNTVIPLRQPSTTIASQRSENSVQQCSVPNEIETYAIDTPNISNMTIDSALLPLQLQNWTNESTNHTPTMSSITSDYEAFPQISLLNAHPVHGQQNDLSSEVSENLLPNFSILNFQSSNLNNSKSYNHEDRDEGDIIVLPNLSALDLTSGTARHSSVEQHEFSDNIPQLSALINLTEVTSDNQVPVL